jgi:ABC-type nitrate/sulfonate/bicarbonate transport system substrate-binding protein
MLSRHIAPSRGIPGIARPAMALVAIAALLSGCGGNASAQGSKDGLELQEVRYQGSVGTVTFAELAESLGYLGDLKLKWVGNTTSGPQDIQATATGDVDFGGAFNGAVIKLASAGAPITAVIGYYGTDENTYNGYFTLTGSPIKSARDLIGKKVGMNTLGAHHEAVLDEYLTRGGLTPDEIKQVVPTVVPPVNTEQALRAGQIDVAVLGGIIRDKALEHGGLTPLFTDYDLFGAFTAGSIVLRDDFIAKNPKTAKRLVTAIGKAIAWTQDQPRDAVVAKFKEIIAKRGRKEDATLVNYWKTPGVAQKGGVIDEKDFVRWIDWLKSQGQLKKDVAAKDLYTNEFNELAGSAS